jgi:hypothetical protein
MAIKPIHYIALGAGAWLAVNAVDIVAQCQAVSLDPYKGQCKQIPKATQALTVISSTATDASPAEVELKVWDTRTPYVYSINVPAREFVWEIPPSKQEG